MTLYLSKLNFKLLTVAVILVAVAILIQNYYGNNQIEVMKFQKNLMTSEDLQNYNGKIIDKLYVAVIGSIFDVSAGSRHYGFGESYHYFVGKINIEFFVIIYYALNPRCICFSIM